MAAQVKAFQDRLPWVLAKDGCPEGEESVLVQLSDGERIHGYWRSGHGWVGMSPDNVRKVIAWAKLPPLHSCSQ